MNIRLDPAFIEKAVELGYLVAYIDRRREPEEVKKREGAQCSG